MSPLLCAPHFLRGSAPSPLSFERLCSLLPLLSPPHLALAGWPPYWQEILPGSPLMSPGGPGLVARAGVSAGQASTSCCVPQGTTCGPDGQWAGLVTLPGPIRGTALSDRVCEKGRGLQRAAGPYPLRDHMTSTCRPRAPVALSPSPPRRPPVAGVSRCLHLVFGFVPSGPLLSQLGSSRQSDLGVRAVLLGLVLQSSALFLSLWDLLQGKELLAGLQHPRGKASSWQLSRGPTSACHPSRPRGFILSLSWAPEPPRILSILIRDAVCEPVCQLFNLL